jgi:hypothetical protein
MDSLKAAKAIKPKIADATDGHRKRLWPFLDQAFLGLVALELNISMARSSGVEQFGLFAVLYLAFILWQGVARGIAAEPLLVFGDRQGEGGISGSSGVVVALVLGCLPGVALCITAILAASGENRGIMLAFAATVPLLGVADACRYWVIGEGSPHLAALLSGEASSGSPLPARTIPPP